MGSLSRACAEIVFGFLGLALQDSIGLPSSVHQGFVAPFVYSVKILVGQTSTSMWVLMNAMAWWPVARSVTSAWERAVSPIDDGDVWLSDAGARADKYRIADKSRTGGMSSEGHRKGE